MNMNMNMMNMNMNIGLIMFINLSIKLYLFLGILYVGNGLFYIQILHILWILHNTFYISSLKQEIRPKIYKMQTQEHLIGQETIPEYPSNSKKDRDYWTQAIKVDQNQRSGVSAEQKEKLHQFFHKKDQADKLIKLIELNLGNSSDISKIFQQNLHGQVNTKKFSQLVKEISKTIKSNLVDKMQHESLVRKIDTKIKQLTVIFENQCLPNNLLHDCIQQIGKKKLNDKLTELGKILAQTCQFTLKIVPLKEQLNYLVSAKLLIVTKQQDKNDLIEDIIRNCNLNHIYQIDRATRYDQRTFIELVQALQVYKDHKMYGEQFYEARKIFVKKLSTTAIAHYSDWNSWNQMIKKFVEDPLTIFSSKKQLNYQILAYIYNQVYNMKQFKDFLKIKIRPQTEQYKQLVDIQKILQFLQTKQRKLTPKDYKRLKENLQKYNLVQFFDDKEIDSKRTPEIYEFMTKQCKNYFQFMYQKSESIKQKKAFLQIELRQKLLELSVPFMTHEKIENYILTQRKQEILKSQLSDQQKKKIFEWVKQKMVQVYSKEFHSVNLRQKIQQQLYKQLIMNKKFPRSFRQIKELIDQILTQKKQKPDTSSLTGSEAKIVLEILKKSALYKQFIQNAGNDYEYQKYKAENQLFYHIMVPKQICGLHAESIKKFIIQFVNNPSRKTIQASSSLSPFHKKVIAPQILKNKQLTTYMQLMKRYLFNIKKQQLRKYVQSQFSNIDCGYEVIYNTIIKYGKIEQGQMQQNEQQQSDDQNINQIRKLKQRQKQKILQCQQTRQYMNYLYQYPKLLQSQKKQLQQALQQKIKNQISLKINNITDAKIKALLKSLKGANYNAKAIQPRNARNYVQGLQEFKEVVKINQVYAQRLALFQQINEELRLLDILAEDLFNKYSDEEKEQIIKIFRNQQSGQIKQKVSSILTSKDSAYLIKLMQKKQGQQTGDDKDFEEQTQQTQQPIKKKPSKLSKQVSKQPKQPKQQKVQKKQEQKPSPTKKQTSVPTSQTKKKQKKPETAQQWIAQIQKSGEDFNTMASNYSFLAKGEAIINTSGKKSEILTIYQGKLEQNRAIVEADLKKHLLDEEKFGSKNYFDSANGNIIKFFTDFDWGTAAEMKEIYKTEYNFKMKSRLTEITKDILSIPNLQGYKKLIAEIETVKKLKAS